MRKTTFLCATPHRFGCRRLLAALLVVLGTASSEAQTLKRGGIDVQACPSRWSLEVNAGVIDLEAASSERLTISLTPRYTLRSRGTTRLQLALPLMWIPEAYRVDWGDPCPAPGCDLPFAIAPEDREAGPAISLTPSLEWTFRTDCCWQPSVFVGAGLWHERGRDSGLGVEASTGAETSPLLTFGAGLRHPISPRLALRFEARASTVFHGDTTLNFDGPAGPKALQLPRDNQTTVRLTVGLEFDL